MDEARLESYRLRLVEWRSELEGLAADAKVLEQPVALDQSRVGRLSRMDALQIQAMASATVRRRIETVERIGAALRRIENGDFGLCLMCEEAIDTRRLDVDPAVTRCIACARSGKPR